MPPKKKQEPESQSPLKAGEQVLWETKDGAAHTGAVLSDESDGKCMVALQTSRGRAPMWPFVLMMAASDLTRA